jgi:hypothetical protein
MGKIAEILVVTNHRTKPAQSRFYPGAFPDVKTFLSAEV